MCQRQEGCVGHLSHPAMESSSGWYRLAVVSSAPATGSPLVLLQQVRCVVCDCVSIGGVVSLYETKKLWLRETWWRLQRTHACRLWDGDDIAIHARIHTCALGAHTRTHAHQTAYSTGPTHNTHITPETTEDLSLNCLSGIALSHTHQSFFSHEAKKERYIISHGSRKQKCSHSTHTMAGSPCHTHTHTHTHTHCRDRFGQSGRNRTQSIDVMFS